MFFYKLIQRFKGKTVDINTWVRYLKWKLKPPCFYWHNLYNLLLIQFWILLVKIKFLFILIRMGEMRKYGNDPNNDTMFWRYKERTIYEYCFTSISAQSWQYYDRKWNESGFRPPLCTYRLNWARRTSWGWWDDWNDTVLQTQDSKFEPWRSEAEHATSRSRRLPTILTFTRGWGRNNFVSFKAPRPGTEPRTLAWRAAVLTTTLGPPPNITTEGSPKPGLWKFVLFVKFRSQHISVFQDWKHILFFTTDHIGADENT